MSVLRALAGVAFAAMAAQAQLTVSLATMSTERPTEIEATIANAGKEELSLLTLGTILDSKPVKKVTVIDEDGRAASLIVIRFSRARRLTEMML